MLLVCRGAQRISLRQFGPLPAAGLPLREQRGIDEGEIHRLEIVARDQLPARIAIANAFLEVRNGAGVVVGKQALGAIDKGEHAIDWKGKGLDGKPLRDGVYTFAVVASDAEGQEVPVKITSTVKVTGILITIAAVI